MIEQTTYMSRDHYDPQNDAGWIISSTFIIFTMQSGFGLLESGSVSVKNELNIMVKNAVDVVCGGLTYWIFGYAFSFGEDPEFSNPVVGWGNFVVHASEDKAGWIYSKFFFQASFATTATTIVSGAMAERTKLTSYMVFSMLNTILFSLPAHWVWATHGWLYSMGVVDIAGAGPVHLVGGLTGLVATLMLKPRHNRYKHKHPPQMSSPTNAVLGMFMLWWGWLGFNCGSTFGISGVKWKLAARSAASTLCSSIAGGLGGLILSYIVKDRKFDVTYMINGLLGSLVAITAICALVQPWEGFVIGFVGSFIANGSVALLNKLKVDDPVGCVGTHAATGAWSLIAAGLFIRKDGLLDALFMSNVQNGLFYGGGFRQLGIQLLAVVSIAGWSLVMALIFLYGINRVIGLRVSLVEEIIGADIVEHGIGDIEYDRKKKALVYPDNDYYDSPFDIYAHQHREESRGFRARSLTGVSTLLGHHSFRREGREIRNEILRETMRQYENEGNNNKQSMSFWKKFRPRRRRFKKRDNSEANLAPSSGSSRTNSDCSAYRVDNSSLERNSPIEHVQIKTMCNGHTVCDNIAIEDDTASEEEVIVQINDNLMPVPETFEEHNELNTPQTHLENELTHM